MDKKTWPEPTKDTLALNGEFHKTFEIEERDSPCIPNRQTIFVRVQLIGGELSELAAGIAATRPDLVLDALTDTQYVVDGTYRTFGMSKLKQQHECTDFQVRGIVEEEPCLTALHSLNLSFAKFVARVRDKNVTEAARALNDLQFSLDFAWRTLGFMHVKFFAYAEVHRSNMTKLGADGKPIKFPSGKIGKGPNFEEPDLRPFLSDQECYPWNRSPWKELGR